jgi:hypothetical protein
VGDRWRKVLRIQVSGEEAVFPAGYEPSLTPLDADLLEKVIAIAYVVDAGTRHERTYTFSPDELETQTGSIPDGTRFVRWLSPSLHPLSPGVHIVDEYVTLSADFWDGLGLDPAINSIPTGTTLADSVEFNVEKRR